MAVDEQRGSGLKARRHGEGIAVVEADQDKAVPAGTVAVDFGFEPAKESFPELQDGLDLVGGDDGVSSGDRRVCE